MAHSGRSRETNEESLDPIAAALAEVQMARQADMEANRLINAAMMDAMREFNRKALEEVLEANRVATATMTRLLMKELRTVTSTAKEVEHQRVRVSTPWKGRRFAVKSKGKGPQVKKSFHKFKGPNSQGTSSARSTPFLCPGCGKEHRGRCASGRIFCYSCGTEGHVLRVCPQREARAAYALVGHIHLISAPPPLPPPPTDQVYALDRQQSDRAPGLVRGIGYFTERAVEVLFDLRTSHSL